MKFVSWKDRKAVAKDLKSVYSAHNEEDAQLALTDFSDIWGKKYPNITMSWTNHWAELLTFFKYPVASEIGMRFILSLVSFSAKLCQNILSDLGI